MKLYRQLNQWQREKKQLKGKTIGFVPTMGALHQGHLSLIERSAQENDFTVLSIFLNPTQFNKKFDLNSYPSAFEQDLESAKSYGATHVLSPSYEELYADDYNYKITEKNLSPRFCGSHRPGHFDGVLTVIMKFLNIVGANNAYFGEKDFQQFQLIKGMTEAFFMSTEIIPCPTIREKDGLPMSSRNLRLNSQQRSLAANFNQILSSSNDVDFIKSSLQKKGFQVDYVETFFGRKLAAVNIDNIRLIDNVSM